MIQHRCKAFTLAELLIALAILGVIATFTIPKVLQDQQDGKAKSIVKEAAGTLSQAFMQQKLAIGLTGSETIGSFTQYLNYVKVDTASTINANPGGSSFTCDSTSPRCVVLHNGAILLY